MYTKKGLYLLLNYDPRYKAFKYLRLETNVTKEGLQ